MDIVVGHGASYPYQGGLMFGKPRKRYYSKDYIRNYVETQPCARCGKQPGPAHHVRWYHWGAGSRKPDDTKTISLCPGCHGLIETDPKEFAKGFGREEVLRWMVENLCEFIADNMPETS